MSILYLITSRGAEIDNIREDDDISVALFNSLFQQVVTVYKSGFITVNYVEDNSIVTVFDVSSTASINDEKMPTSPSKCKTTKVKKSGKNQDIVTEDCSIAQGSKTKTKTKTKTKNTVNSAGHSAGKRSNNHQVDVAVHHDPINGGSHEEETMQMKPFISHCCFDKLQRRLVVSTREQTIQLWNFNNGECLQIIEPQLPSMKFNIPLGDIRISALSCNDAFLGIRKTVRKFMFFGSTNGFAFGLQDIPSGT